MATALELLTGTADVCVISTDTKEIHIPSSILPFGVESDEKSKIVKFQMDDILSEVDSDITKFHFYVNYKNAKGVKDKYVVTDVNLVDDKITFSWVLGRTATTFKGNLFFVVCICLTDDEGRITWEWNTTLGSGPVLEGLEMDDEAIDENVKIDIVAQLVRIITDSGTISTAVDKYLADKELEVETKFTEHLVEYNEYRESETEIVDKLSTDVQTIQNGCRKETVLYTNLSGFGASGQSALFSKSVMDYDYVDFYMSFFGKTEIRRIQPELNVSYAFRSFNLPNDGTSTGISFNEIVGSFTGEKNFDISSATKWAWSGKSTDNASLSVADWSDLCAGYIYKIVGIKEQEEIPNENADDGQNV